MKRRARRSVTFAALAPSLGGVQDRSLKELMVLYRQRRRDREQATTRRRRQGAALPHSFAELLHGFYKKQPEVLERIEQSRALGAWAEYVGEAAARVSEPLRIRHGVLTVKVTDSLWMQQLSLLKHGIIAHYRRDFPKLGIRDLYFTRR